MQHLIYTMINFFAENAPPPGTKPFEESIEYPLLSESRNDWDMYSETFIKGMAELSAEQLSSSISFQIPTGGNTLKDAFAFFAMHECYHIGQMSIIRKALGYPSMILI